jgi:hypothetical protein
MSGDEGSEQSLVVIYAAVYYNPACNQVNPLQPITTRKRVREAGDTREVIVRPLDTHGPTRLSLLQCESERTDWD